MLMRAAAVAFALSIALVACTSRSASSSGTSQVTEQEAHDLQPVIARYKSQSVMGFDVKGTTLAMNVDAEGWSELDESTDIAIRDAVLSAWAQSWETHHPRQHAVLHLRVQNYYGQEITTQSKSV